MKFNELESGKLYYVSDPIHLEFQGIGLYRDAYQHDNQRHDEVYMKLFGCTYRVPSIFLCGIHNKYYPVYEHELYKLNEWTHWYYSGDVK